MEESSSSSLRLSNKVMICVVGQCMSMLVGWFKGCNGGGGDVWSSDMDEDGSSLVVVVDSSKVYESMMEHP